MLCPSDMRSHICTWKSPSYSSVKMGEKCTKFESLKNGIDQFNTTLFQEDQQMRQNRNTSEVKIKTNGETWNGVDNNAFRSISNDVCLDLTSFYSKRSLSSLPTSTYTEEICYYNYDYQRPNNVNYSSVNDEVFPHEFANSSNNKSDKKKLMLTYHFLSMKIMSI